MDVANFWVVVIVFCVVVGNFCVGVVVIDAFVDVECVVRGALVTCTGLPVANGKGISKLKKFISKNRLI